MLEGRGPTIDTLNSTYFNYKEVGKIDEKDNIKIFISQVASDSILKRTKKPINPKTFGLLLGSKIKRENQYLIHIGDIVPLGMLKPDKDPKALSDKRWRAIQRKVNNLYPHREIVGWYGVRDGWGAMLTEQDQRIHRELFTKSWQVIYLLDDASNSSSFFYWNRDKLKPCNGYFEYCDKNTDKTLQGSSKDKRLLIYGSIAILGVISITLLSQQFGQYNSATKGYNNDELAQDNLDETVNEYITKIAQLEEKLEEQQQEIEVLVKNKPSLEPSEHLNLADQEEGVIYIIQSGDNLYSISEKFYDTDKYGSALAKVNRIEDQKSLRIGSYIIIPPIEEIENVN